MFVSRQEDRPQMRGVRRAAVAGLFYPQSGDELGRTVDELLQGAAGATSPPPKAILAPHAGYVYSGPVAASAMQPLRACGDRVERVVLIGPSHHVAFEGVALPAASSFETPLGEVEIDVEAARPLLDLPQVRLDDLAHAREHALEVELPFLQRVLDDFRIVPLVVGEASVAEVSEVLERLWGGPETLVVISSDLSHFLDHQTACRVDRQTVERIERLDASLDPRQACGAAAINGFLPLAQRHRLAPRTLDRRTSGDTAGDRDRVVGYCAMTFCAAEAA